MPKKKENGEVPKVERKTAENMWTFYRVRWMFLDKLCAQVPADPEIRKIWLDTRQPKVRPAGGKSIVEIQEEVANTLAEQAAEQKEREEAGEEIQESLLVFQRHNGGLVMRAGTVRSHLKDCARNISSQYVGKIQGERTFATRLVNGVYPDPSVAYIPILRQDGTPISKPDDTKDKPVHAKGPRGEPINAIKTFEYVTDCRMDFTLRVLGNSVHEHDLEILFEYAGSHGYAGERGDGDGKYMFDFRKIQMGRDRWSLRRSLFTPEELEVEAPAMVV